MKILLVQAHLGRVDPIPHLFPLGLCYIATALKQHTVKILDLNFWEWPVALQGLRQEIKDYDPNVVGLSIRNVDTVVRADVFCYIKTVRPTAQAIKETKPDVKLIVGGTGFSLFAQTIMERVPEFDFGVYLEGEESMPELLGRLESPETVRGVYIRRDGAVMFTGHREPSDFPGSPIPRRDTDLIDMQRYQGKLPYPRIGIQTKRGCPLECAYCNYPVISGRKVRLRPPPVVVDEIEYLSGLGINQFAFVDNMFNVPERHALEICQEILRRKLAVEWTAYYEIKSTSEDLLRIASQAGCTLFEFSPDAATDKGLALLKKGITTKDIERIFALVRKHNVKMDINFFLLPGLSNIIRTLLLSFKYKHALSSGGIVYLDWIRILPDTDLYRLALAEGRLTKETDMMPENEKDLDHLFYHHTNRFIDRLTLRLIRFLGQENY